MHLEDLNKVPSDHSEAYHRWNSLRLDRILVDYLLREGYYDTATRLASDNHLHELVDIDLFVSARKVEESLQKGSCTECLQWCSENKSKLKKMESTLEFNLRMQEFIELIKQNRLQEAIAYARKHFAAWVDTHMRDIQKAMALLAFAYKGPNSQVYAELYNPSRWFQLVEQFRADNFALFSLTSQPLISISLQAGLSALKSPMCYMVCNISFSSPPYSSFLFLNFSLLVLFFFFFFPNSPKTKT